MYRLDAALGVSPPTDLADAQVPYGLAASGDTVGLDYIDDPDSSVVRGMTAANGSSAPSNFVVGGDAACPQTPGCVAKAAGGADSFAFTWPMNGSTIGYRAFGADGTALGPAVAPHVFSVPLAHDGRRRGWLPDREHLGRRGRALRLPRRVPVGHTSGFASPRSGSPSI